VKEGRWTVCFLSLCCVALIGVSYVQAQDSPTTTSMATYYRCVQGDAARSDTIFKEHVVPFFNAEKGAGRITSFGWLKHWSGGEWRRLFYFSGNDPDKLLDSYLGLIKMAQSPEHAKAMDEFDRICSSHDDYTWRSKSGSQTGTSASRARSPFVMSTYYVCNAQEPEADYIVKTFMAPVLNQRVKDHKIDAWVWNEHLMGGKYRRQLVVDGANAKALLQHWSTLQDELQKANPDLSHRFTQICDSHSDYIWEVAAQ
jgi:hypothetical protein